MAKQATPIKPDRMAAARAAKAAKVAAANAEFDEIDDDVPAAPARKAAVAPTRKGAVSRATIRQTTRPQTLRDEFGRVAALGRDGQLLSRKVNDTGDKFFVAPELIPDGWTYQWIAASVVGKLEKTSHFAQNGWTSVPSSRHDGMWMAPGYKGGIEQEGLILVERPKVLTDDARAEEIGRARQQLRTQNDQFKPKLPNARDRGIRGTGLQARRTIEGMPPDIGQPAYEIASDEGLV